MVTSLIRNMCYCVQLKAGLERNEPIASNRAPRQRGPRATPTNLRKQTFIQSCICNPDAEPTVFFRREPRCQRKQKWTARFVNVFNHHNSFFEFKSGHCFSAMFSLVFSIAAIRERGLCFEAVFCFSFKRFIFDRWSFNSYCKIRFDSYCCFSSYHHLSSEGLLLVHNSKCVLLGTSYSISFS